MTTIRFSNLEPDEAGGLREVDIKVIKHSDIIKCPTFILWPGHWRADGTCRHDEPDCEMNNCNNIKFEDEIFCKQHSEEEW